MIDTQSEEHRRRCEARWVLSHDRMWRIKYYSMVESKRGSEAARQLVDDVKSEIATKRKAA